MKFLFRPKNESHRTYLRLSCERSLAFSAQRKLHFGTKTKNKTKMKIHFRPKMEKDENDQIANFRRRKRISVGFKFDGLT